jgi:hypothetical protein
MTPAERMQATADLIGDRGSVPDPWAFAKRIGKSHDIGEYLAHFGAYLKACGVRNFTALEVSTPSKSSQRVAAKTGASKSMYRGQFVLVLPVWLWQPMAACVLLADQIRDALGAPVTLRNGVRPWDLSRNGDLDAAHAVADELYAKHAEDLEISIGQGDTVIHIGIHSPAGHRRWNY